MQQVHVEGVALDPLAAIEQTPQVSIGLSTVTPHAVLDRVAGAHLVGDGADATDPRRDVGRLGEVATLQECLEEPRRLDRSGGGRRCGPALVTTYMAPSPSTCASPLTVRSRVAGVTPAPPSRSTGTGRRARGLEGGGGGVEGPERATRAGCPPRPRPAMGEGGGVRRLHRSEAAIAAAIKVGQSAPHPACVTGPRQGVPCATITHTFPWRLHPWQTLWRGCSGGVPAGTRREPPGADAGRRGSRAARSRRLRGARSASRSRVWTRTRDAGRRRRGNSPTSAKLRRAWIPPAVAQAPIVTSRRDVTGSPESARRRRRS